MIKKVATVAILWIVSLYAAQACAIAFGGDTGSGGPQKGYAEDIACHRNWWAFGLLWDCTATIVTDNDKRIPYRSNNSALTPADIGNKVPMTVNQVRSGRSSAPSPVWGLAEDDPPDRVPRVLGLMGFPVVATIITFRVFRDQKLPAVKNPPRTDKLDPKFRR